MKQNFDPAPTLAEFLLARIAEDEEIARAAEGWFQSTDFTSSRAEEHAHRHAPARVLAECEAKRWFVERLGPPHHLTGGSSAAYDEVLRMLALPYADHPDWREEWRP